MVTASKLFEAYLDANIALGLTALIWALASALLGRTFLRNAFLTHLRLTYGILITFALIPAGLIVMSWLQKSGLMGQGATINLSDFAVAQYLNGRFALTPSQFENLLTIRADFTHMVVGGASVIGWAIAVLLVTGMFATIFRLAWNVWGVWTLVNRSYKWRRIGRVELRFTDEIHVPFSTRGLRCSYIILPSAFLSRAADMRIAVAHELQHMRQGDLVWEFILESMRPLFFWNPAFHFWKREIERLRELACDQQVLIRRGIGVKAYCECLLRVCHDSLRNDNRDQIHVPVVSFAPVGLRLDGGRAAALLQKRVISLLQGPKKEFRDRMLTKVLLVPLIAAILVGAMAAQRSGDWSQDRLTLSTIVNLERLDQRNGIPW